METKCDFLVEVNSVLKLMRSEGDAHATGSGICGG